MARDPQAADRQIHSKCVKCGRSKDRNDSHCDNAGCPWCSGCAPRRP